jgi:DNA primase
MPGIDFDRLRREIQMEDVLYLLAFEPTQRTGDQWYGGCPLHGSNSDRSRCFSVNVATHRYCCHKCHSHGNQLELWAAFTKRKLHPAMIDLCHALGREVPWIRRW